MFTPKQGAYLKALANIGGGPRATNEIEKLAAATYGVALHEKNLPKQMLHPLEKAGNVLRSTATDGRNRSTIWAGRLA